MRRRALLQAAGATSVGLLAGCTADGTGGGSTDGTDETDSPSPSPTVTPCEEELTQSSLAVRSVECGTGANSADASVDPVGPTTPDDGEAPTYTVTVTGTIDASDPCHSARIESVRAEPSEDTLRLGVETYVPEENQGEACTECIADVEYEATAAFRCEYPGVVVVVHDGEQVAELPLPE